MNDHTVKAFNEELALLDRKIAHMGGLAEHVLGQAFDALEKRDQQTEGTKAASAPSEGGKLVPLR